MSSSAWRRFYESFFGDMYMSWHDGLDVAAIDALTPEQKTEAEKLLMDALSNGDWRAPTGLSALGVTASAPLMKAGITGAGGNSRVILASALWKLEQWPDAVDHLVQVLENDAFWSTRMNAAIALGDLGDAAPQAALWRAVEHDPDALVRNHAAHSLLRLHGLSQSIAETQPLALAMMKEDKVQRAEALAALREVIKGSAAL
jgi:HEAT repeat protein